MQPSVQSFCNALSRSKLLAADEIRGLYQRWVAEARDKADDLNQFTKWLEVRQYATAYQIGVLSRGRGEQLLLGPYKLLDRIGRGRMAGVFKAAHNLGQLVAIKILPPSKAKDATAFGRFQREARLSVKLKHPNTVRTFQLGQHRDLHYLVMEYLEGETLAEVLQRRGKLSPTEAARLLHQALMGLQHIHELGLVHRDLNPGNLMLVGGQPTSTLQATVKILDIGMGRALFDEGAPGTPGADLTAAGDILGSPDYMSPEQARDAHGADIRADIYSAGCILYHLLAGQPPFADTNRVRQLVRHAKENPRPVKDFNPAVPDGLQQILNWMLAKDPAQRYPTPDRAAQALQVFLTAGAEVRGIEAEPQMARYLSWLEASGDEILDVEPAEGTDVDVELAAPLSSGCAPEPQPRWEDHPGAEPPGPAGHEGQQPGRRDGSPSGSPGRDGRLVVSSPGRQPATGPAGDGESAAGPDYGRTSPSRRAARPTVQDVQEVEEVSEVDDVQDVEDVEEAREGKGKGKGEEKGLSFSRRDIMMLGFGIGGILVLLLIFGGLYWGLTRNRDTPKISPTQLPKDFPDVKDLLKDMPKDLTKDMPKDLIKDLPK